MNLSTKDWFYNRPEWHRLRAKTLSRWRASGLPCSWCGKPLDWSTKGSIVVDHIQNRRHRPDLALEPENLAAVHTECNTRKYHFAEANKREEIGLDGLPSSWK